MHDVYQDGRQRALAHDVLDAAERALAHAAGLNICVYIYIYLYTHTYTHV